MAEKKEKEGKIIIRWSWRKILTVLCGVVFSTALVLFFVSFILQQTLLNPTYYKNNLKQIDAYQRMINEGIPSLILKTHISNNPLTDTMAKDISTLLLQKFMDPTWLEGVADTFIDTTINYLTQKDNEIVLNLTDARDYLNRASGGLLIVREFIPSCDPGKGKELLSALCTDKKVNPDEIKKDIDAIRKEIDTVNLGAVKVDTTISLINANVSTVRTFAKNIRAYMAWSLIVMVLMIICIVVFQWKRLAIIIRSLSFFSGMGSLVTLLFGLLASQMVPRTLGQNREIILSQSIRSILQDFVSASISGVFTHIELYTLIVMVISFTVFGLSYIKRK